MDENKEQFYLDDEDAALIFAKDGTFTFAIPKQNDDDFVPEYIRYCIGLAVLWKKDDTREVLMQMIDDVYEEFMKATEGEEDGEA